MKFIKFKIESRKSLSHCLFFIANFIIILVRIITVNLSQHFLDRKKWQNLATFLTLVLMEEIVTKESEILFHPFHCPSLCYCDKVSFVRGHIVVTSRESDRIKNSQKMNMENYFIISIRKLIKRTLIMKCIRERKLQLLII